MLIGVAEEERSLELLDGSFSFLAERNTIKLKPYFEEQRCVSELDTSYGEEEIHGMSGLCGFTLVGLLSKSRGSAWCSGKEWGLHSSHFRSWFEFCDHLLFMTPLIFYLTFLSFVSLIWENRNNEIYCLSLISLSIPRTNPQAN